MHFTASKTLASFVWFALAQVHLHCMAANIASLEATSKSLYQTPLTWVAPGVGTVVTFFTTYDGTSGLPLFDSATSEFSGEIRPRSGQPGTFEADYLNLNLEFGILAYGSTTFSIPASDGDQNGLPDVFEFKKASTVSYTGTIRSDYPSVNNFTTRGTFIKKVGEYSISNSLLIGEAPSSPPRQNKVRTFLEVVTFRSYLKPNRTNSP